MASNKLIEKKMRGTATQYKDGNFEFTPQGTGSPMYDPVKKVGDAVLSKTLGTKQQNYVAHLKTPVDSVDPAADMRSQLEKLLEPLNPSDKKLHPHGQTLAREEGVLCTLNKPKGTLEIGICIDLSKHVDYMKEFYRIYLSLSQCLHINNTSLRQLCRSLATSSTASSTTPDSKSK